VKFLRSKRGLAAAAALLFILFIWRPGVYRLRDRIAGSIGSALGRTVTIDNVRLRLLPRPGFDLEGLVIHDDPSFSAEPMIRAQEVSAAIRFRSLLRGRLEIATLSATDPSINLVRNAEGRWNLASLIERNAQIPAAPTAKPAYERRPAFPYLEASNARINFKIGQTKKSYALIDADVTLWQGSENSWGARIKAAPVRTDFNLTDTGLLQIDATWQRAANLRLTPLQISAQWEKGQLGQITKLFSGKDRGWRGGVTLRAKLSGTPEALRMESQTVVDDFHRYDIPESENVRLATVCSGQYSAADGTVTDLLCESPVSGGDVRLYGNLAALNESPSYDLTLNAEKIPVASVIRILRQAKKQISSNLNANGLLSAEFHANGNVNALGNEQRVPTHWSGGGAVTDARLLVGGSSAGKNEIAFGAIPLQLVAGGPPMATRSHAKSSEKSEHPAEPYLQIGPATMALRGATPLNVGGWLSSTGYRFDLRGDTELGDLFRIEDILGLPVTRPAAEGSAKLDVSISGPWQGFAPSTTLGTAQLRGIRGEMHGLNTPIEIDTTSVSLTPDAVALQKISARTGSTHWTGSVTRSRHCDTSGTVLICALQFDLTADQLTTDDLAEWFTPQSAKRPWYRILNSSEPRGVSPLLALKAHGNLHIGRFGVKKAIATQVAAEVDVNRGKITLTSLHAQLLKGTLQGNWIIDVPVPNNEVRRAEVAASVRYHGTGILQNVALEQVGALMNEAWISGTGDGKFDWQGSGNSFHEWLSTSTGSLQFAMRNGSLSRVEIPGSVGPLPVHRLAGDLRLEKGLWKLSDGKLESRDGLYMVSGTASAASGFDFVLKRADDRSWSLTGTLARPRVAPIARTEATRSEAELQIVKP
jgi:hypothetical protein